ncbi:DUF1259 domain-containing protein, partial [Bacillus sp. B-TM1]
IHNEWLCDDPNLIYVNIEDVENPHVIASHLTKETC